MKRLLILLLFLCAACGSNKDTIITNLKYTVKDSLGNADLSNLQFNIEIPKRYNSKQLDTISSILRANNLQYKALNIFYLLSGQVVGDGFVYGNVFYSDNTPTSKLQKVRTDLNGYESELSIWGASQSIANDLLKTNPPNPESKTIVGKFINDVDQTVTVIYKDKRESDRLYIMDFDKTGKNIPSQNIAPVVQNENGAIKMVIDADGDYFLLDGDILERYNLSESKSIPYRRIKSNS